ncbi:hypothetical protein L873DRAFT_1807216 [Choiromyces venosus 120613-1]|uniref:Uncharacterized protein n=1 Tax=Choiromyces venosus 120613-1 TaxID=1336337 RepID=A0A3N4JP95_9PEZI|nr:hypothetical protein L873DRAFT_1807216 [Choiromyces venosus 120613-1]
MAPKAPKSSKHFPLEETPPDPKKAKSRHARKTQYREKQKAAKPETKDVGTQTRKRKSYPIRGIVNQYLEKCRQDRLERSIMANVARRANFDNMRQRIKAQDRKVRRSARHARIEADIKYIAEKAKEEPVTDAEVVKEKEAEVDVAEEDPMVDVAVNEAIANPSAGEVGEVEDDVELPEPMASTQPRSQYQYHYEPYGSGSDEHYSSDFAVITVEDLLDDGTYSLVFDGDVYPEVVNVLPSESA